MRRSAAGWRSPAGSRGKPTRTRTTFVNSTWRRSSWCRSSFRPRRRHLRPPRDRHRGTSGGGGTATGSAAASSDRDASTSSSGSPGTCSESAEDGEPASRDWIGRVALACRSPGSSCVPSRGSNEVDAPKVRRGRQKGATSFTARNDAGSDQPHRVCYQFPIEAYGCESVSPEGRAHLNSIGTDRTARAFSGRTLACRGCAPQIR